MAYINLFNNTNREIEEHLDYISKSKKLILQKRRASGMQVLLYNTKTKTQEMQIVWKMEATSYKAPCAPSGSPYEYGVFFYLCDGFDTTIYIQTESLIVANELLREFVQLHYLDLTEYNIKTLGIYPHYGKLEN